VLLDRTRTTIQQIADGPRGHYPNPVKAPPRPDPWAPVTCQGRSFPFSRNFILFIYLVFFPQPHQVPFRSSTRPPLGGGGGGGGGGGTGRAGGGGV
jgi:hypothetical protein